MSEELSSAIVKSDVFEKMLFSSMKLRNFIRRKNDADMQISVEEANFVNDFEAYFAELSEVIEKQSEEESK